MIGSDGYRKNVGIILSHRGKVFWGRRIGQNAWQFPQGGIKADETPSQALYRELHEEIGLSQSDVEIIGYTSGWIRYQIPKRLIRYGCKPLCLGQKQVWYLLRLISDEEHFHFDLTGTPEFDDWRWVDYWEPINQVIFFKRCVYQTALRELAPLVVSEINPEPE